MKDCILFAQARVVNDVARADETTCLSILLHYHATNLGKHLGSNEVLRIGACDASCYSPSKNLNLLVSKATRSKLIHLQHLCSNSRRRLEMQEKMEHGTPAGVSPEDKFKWVTPNCVRDWKCVDCKRERMHCYQLGSSRWERKVKVITQEIKSSSHNLKQCWRMMIQRSQLHPLYSSW